MIFVTHQLPVNVEGEPRLDRAAVWDGLVLKANNALPFVPSMTYCEVTQRHGDTVFDRDIDFRGERFTERITLERPHRVTCLLWLVENRRAVATAHHRGPVLNYNIPPAS